jgi:site-specific DNA recombinase
MSQAATSTATVIQDGPARAVLYLRVSTKEQAEMGGEAEGFSIPAQREAGRRKAESLRAVVVEEFVDRGESAKSADRPELQRMLAYVAEQPVSFVIVHKVDRLARNRVDDVEINLALKKAGAQLVSVTENIDETPSGILLHGIMSTIAEFYSRNLANEVIKGSTQKARSGGTVGKAPIGYRNIRRMVDGREVRTIKVDAERAPLVRWAFDAYAGGNYTLRQLTAELNDRGLTHHATLKQPERPLTMNRVHEMLSRRYYLGYVSYKGVEYEGKHDRLVTPELFEQVQQRLRANRQAGDRAYRRQHYLKGTVVCGRCQSRLLYFISTGNGGRYEYFRCSGQHAGRTACGLPHLPAYLVEAEVVAAYCYEQLTPDELSELRQTLEARLNGYAERAQKERERLTTRARQLKRERYKWAEKAMNDAVPDDIAREKQRELGQQLTWTEGELAKLEVKEADVRRLLDAALKLAGNCQTAYQASPPDVRRMWNQAWWESVEIDIVDGEPTVVKVNRTPVAAATRADAEQVRLERRWRRDGVQIPTMQTDASLPGVGSNVDQLVDRTGRRSNIRSGSNFELLVGVRGLEPLTSRV